MLDTDTCSYGMKRSKDALLKRLPGKRCVHVGHQQGGLSYGVEISPRRRQDQTAMEAFLHYVEILDFSEEAAAHYAKIRTELKVVGT